MCSLSESNNGATSPRSIDEMSSTSSNSSRSKTPIDQNDQTPLQSQSHDKLPNGFIKHGIPSGKSIKKALLKRFKSQNPSPSPKKVHRIMALDEYGCSTVLPNSDYSVKVHATSDRSDRNSSQPGPSRSPRNVKIAASTSSAKVTPPKLTLIDLFAGQSGIDINISKRANIRPPSNTSSSSSSLNSCSSQASTTPIEIMEKTLGKQSTQKTITPPAKKRTPPSTLPSKKRQLPKSVTLGETSLATKTAQNASEEWDRPGTATTSPSFSPNSSLEEYDGNNRSSESGTSTIPLVATKKLKTATKGELKNSYLDYDASINKQSINYVEKSPENDLEIEELQVENQDQVMYQTGNAGSTPIHFQSTRARKTEGTAKKIRKKKVVRTHYYKAVARTLRRTQPKSQITLPSLQIMDNFMKDMFDRLATEAGRLMRISGRKTMTARDIHYATTLVLPEKLAAKATWAGGKALETFAKETNRLQRNIEKPRNEIENQQEKSS